MTTYKYYNKMIGRLRLDYLGTLNKNLCVKVTCVGMDIEDSCALPGMSVEEAHDLRYLLDRMIAAAAETSKE